MLGWQSLQSGSVARLQFILSGQSPSMILRSCRHCQSRQCLAVVPRHPLRWILLQLRSVSLQLGEIVERIGSIEFARVDQTHEEITHGGPVQGFVEERIFPVPNRQLEAALDDVVVERDSRLLQEKRQLLPVPQ